MKRGRGRDSKKKNWGNEVLVEREGVNLSVADKIGQCLTLVYTHVLPEVIVTAKVLSASFDGTLVRLLVCVDRSHMPLQMLTASKALVAPVDGAPVHPHVLLHTALHDEHRSRRHTAPARLFCEVWNWHWRTQTTRSRSTHAAAPTAHTHAAGPS